MLDIEMSELMNSDVNEICEAARTSLNDTHPDSESLNDESNVGLEPRYQGCNPFDARGVARINPLSEVSRDGTPLDVGKDIVGDTPRHSGICHVNARGVARKYSLCEGGCDSTSLDVGNDIVGDRPIHSGLCPLDARGVTRKLSRSDVGNDIQ